LQNIKNQIGFIKTVTARQDRFLFFRNNYFSDMKAVRRRTDLAAGNSMDSAFRKNQPIELYFGRNFSFNLQEFFSNLITD
jgi:hypothetical protein